MNTAAETPARTLPAHAYRDESVFELEKEHILFRTWQYGCHASRLARAGSYYCLDFIDQSLVFVRDEDGAVRGFHNVCRHRAHRLLEGEGCTRAIVCPYHAWTYTLDGRLVRARGSERVRGFDLRSIAMSPVRVERFLDLYLFNLDADAPSFESQVPGLAEEIRARVPRLDGLVPETDRAGFGAATLVCNWKVLVDNCIECYHCAPAHPAFVDLVDMDTYRIALHARHSSHSGLSRKPDNAAYAYRDDPRAAEFAFWHIWPNLTFGTFPGSPNFGVFSIDPVNASLTRSRGDSFVLPGPESAEERARRRYVAEVLWPEDKSICESVQRGLRSRGYDRGPLIVPPGHGGASEEVVELFQRLTAAALPATLERGP